MITITPIPMGTASVSSLSLLVQVKESLCQAFGANSKIQPQSSITFNAGTATTQAVVVGGATVYNAMLPITVVGSITYLPKGSCRAVTKLFTETFTVAFSGLTTSPTTFTVNVGQQTKEPTNIKCCNRAYGYTINTAINITAA